MQTIVEAKVTALQFAKDILQWVEKLAVAFRDSGSGPFVSKTWDDLAEIRLVACCRSWRVTDRMNISES